MGKYLVTLRAELKRGLMYWVCQVDAGNEDEAMTKAESAFTAEIDDPGEWSFSDGDVESL